jgi:hypothetical protein
MSNKPKIIRYLLGVILIIVAINAFGGGYYGMAGAENVPVEWLQDSPFKNYFLPSLILFVIVGGVCLTAAIMVLLQDRRAKPIAYTAGTILLLWIGVQLLIIGYVSWLQPAMVLSGLLILLLAAQITWVR